MRKKWKSSVNGEVSSMRLSICECFQRAES
jgi:hypothetical protein